MSIYSYKKPKDKSNYVGIEIEFSCPATENMIEKAVKKYSLQKYVELGEDADPEPGHLSFELRVLVLEEELKDVIFRVGRMLDGLGATVNSSCGLHVHLDMRTRDVTRAFNNLSACQGLLFSLANKNRKDNHFCQEVNTRDYLQYDLGHYGAINAVLEKDKYTIEIRIKEGTVDAIEIYRWCILLIEIADSSLIEEKVTSFKNTKNMFWNINDKVKSFLDLKKAS